MGIFVHILSSRIVDVITNLKNFDGWDYKHYPLTKEEADTIIEVVSAASNIVDAFSDNDLSGIVKNDEE